MTREIAGLNPGLPDWQTTEKWQSVTVSCRMVLHCDMCREKQAIEARSRQLCEQLLKADGWTISECSGVVCPECNKRRPTNDP